MQESQAIFFAGPTYASAQPVATTWRLLDYIAVDYPEAVQNGAIVNQLEYDEMLVSAHSDKRALPAVPIA